MTHSLLGVSLLAATVAGVPASAGAQNSWQGFSATSTPSGLQAGGPNASPAWSAAVGTDLGGAGVDIWVNNHAEKSEGLEDYNAGTGLFTDAVVSPLMLADTHGAIFTDFDGDGDEDLIEIMGRDNENHIFKNTGGNLALVATVTGLEDELGRGRQPIMVDIDNDGDMDIFVGNLDRQFLPDEEEAAIAAPSELYINNGDSTFTKAADPDGVMDDGSIRLMSLTSTGPGEDQVVLTHNTFAIGLDTIPTGSATLAEPAASVKQFLFAAGNVNLTRDVALGDLDGDLAPEFVAARQDDFLADEDTDWEGMLPLVTGNISTSNLSSTVATAVSTSALADNCRSIALADYDNDADLDIFGGCTMKENGQDTNVLLLNDGTGNFTVAGAGLMPTTTDDTASVVVNADLNQDGWIDTYVGGGYDSQPGPDFVFINDGGGGNHWLGINLVGSNPDAMGAQVFVGTDKWQVRESGHRMHQGQDMKSLHFGLGSQTDIAPVEIMWPDGTFETCTVAGIDQYVTITQGSASCAAQTKSGLQAAVAADPDTGPPPVDKGTCAGRPVTVSISMGDQPTAGNDVILGTESADTINALGGDDVVCGLGGDDIINGGDGIDRIYGHAGNDTINGDDGRDRIWGGDGNDTMTGGKNRDVMVGNRGRDTITGNSGRDRINGSVGNDIINGNGGDDQLKGGRGVDVANGGIGSDLCVDIEVKSKCEL